MQSEKSFMQKVFYLYLVLVTGGVVGLSFSSYGFDLSLDGYISLRGEGDLNFSGPLTHFVENGGYFYSYLQLRGEIKRGKWGGVLTLNSWELSKEAYESGSMEDRAKSRFFIDELYFLYGNEKKDVVSLKAGWLNFLEGDGYIVDDFYPGAEIWISPFEKTPVYFNLHAYKVELKELVSGSTSFFVGGRSGWRFSEYEEAGVSFDFLYERDESMKNYLNETIWSYLRVAKIFILDNLTKRFGNQAQMIYYSLLQSEIVSSASSNLFWINAFFNRFFLDEWEGKFLGSLCLGSSDAEVKDIFTQGDTFNTVNIKILGYLFKFYLERNIKDILFVKGSLLWMGGSSSFYNDLLKHQEINAFMSFRPLIYDSAIFFQNSINRGFHTSEIQVAGIMGTGFLVPSMKLSFIPAKTLEISLKNIFIFSEKKPPNVPSSFMGYEVNLNAWWEFVKDFSLSVEFDLFTPGDFMNNVPSLAYTIIGGVDWNFNY